MSSGRGKLMRASKHLEHANKRIAKQRKRMRTLERRHAEMLAQLKTGLTEEALRDRVKELETYISEHDATYRLEIRESSGRIRAVILRGHVAVWEGKERKGALKPRDLRRANKVLDAFERCDP